MKRIYSSSSELIGNTPLIELTNIERELKIKAHIIAKPECFNPGGSAKDRVARAMIGDAETRGLLKPGATIIEPTSGNTGIGLAAVAVPKGYRVIIVMPDNMSEERKKIISAFGAELVLTDGSLGMGGAIEEAKRLHAEIEGSFIPDQFANPANAKAHYFSTGPEIWRDTDGEIDYFIAGVGTGGTITGVGKYLKEQSENVKIIGVEPKNSAVLSRGVAGKHNLQGIGAGFIPEVLDVDIIDEVIAVSDEEAYEAGRMLSTKEGLLSGISSGAALFAAIEIAKREENEGKNIVVLLPDTGDRYLSTELFI